MAAIYFFPGPDKEFPFKDRCEPVCVAPEERVKSFCKVDQGLDEDAAGYESGRCLQCDLGMKIATVKVWGRLLIRVRIGR